MEALLNKDSCQMLAERAESLGVDHTSFEIFKSIRNVSNAQTSRTSIGFFLLMNNCFNGRKIFFLHRIIIMITISAEVRGISSD